MSTTVCESPTAYIDEARIAEKLEAGRNPSPFRAREVLAKARTMEGLTVEEAAVLSEVREPSMVGEMFAVARAVNEEIYGNRLVPSAPLCISDLCENECAYCLFRASNQALTRQALTQEEIARATRLLIDQGHQRLLLVAGESYPKDQGFDYVLDAIATIKQTRSARGEIRRVDLNIAPLTVAGFKDLKAAQIGTYQLLQETYHRGTYAKVHLGGMKADYDWRGTALDRAMRAGIDDVGVGVLLGLYGWKFEVLALLQHAQHLEAAFGVGPRTISVPRMEAVAGSALACRPPHPVSDEDFKKVVAILRLAAPYTGIIISTRENAATRRAAFQLGVSHISAGSPCDPGGYPFQLGDRPSLDEVVRDIASLGYAPSFGTPCHPLGRTGAESMEIAGQIETHITK